MIANDLSRLLAQRSEEIALLLLPNGIKKANEWCVGSIDGSSGDSLKVRLNGIKSGVWCDFQTGQAGDLLDLWALTKNITISEAMKQVSQYFNLSIPKASYGIKKKTFVKPPLRHLESLKDTSPVHTYLVNERGLLKGVIEAFRIPQSNDEIIFNYYRDSEVLLIKTLKLKRLNGKKQMFMSANSQPCLFGWHTIPSLTRKIIICEGEIDAMSFYQYGFPALSIPYGGGRENKQSWIEYECDRLNQFDEIYLSMDNDETGRETAREISERLGLHRCKIVHLPLKDANECLINGISTADIASFLKEANTFDPEELEPNYAFDNEAYEIINPTPGKFLGYRLGWNKCDGHIIFRPSGLTLWVGYNGHGKTLFLGQVMLQLIEQGAKICIASMELSPAELMARTYIQGTGLRIPSREYMNKVSDWLTEKLYIFNLVGTGNIERLLEVFLYARMRYGVDVFIVDSLTTLNIAEDDFNGQKELAATLRDFKIKYNCHIHLVAHPRKPRDESIIPGKYDIRGAGAISDLADNCFAVWRNKEKEEAIRKKITHEGLTCDDLEQLRKPDTYLRCDKNRHGVGAFKEGTFSFWFHEPSYQYLERENNKPKKFVNYSCISEN